MQPEEWPDASWTALLWLNNATVFHATRGASECGLLDVPVREREFRLHFARTFRARSLMNFLHEGIWPDVHQFIDTYQSVLQWEGHRDAVRWLLQLHRDLTEIWNRFPSRTIRPSSQCLNHPTVGLRVRDKVILFASLSPLAINKLLAQPPPTKPHPATAVLTNLAESRVGSIIRFYDRNRRWLLPVYHDVLVRILFRVLPSGSRFAFLQRLDPTIITCPQTDCLGVETYNHLFVTCPHAEAIWDQIWCDWSGLVRGELSLDVLLDISAAQQVLDDGAASALRLLWHVMRSITIRTIWIDRNRIVFEQSQARQPRSLVLDILVIFAAHFRAILRHSDEEDHRHFYAVLDHLNTTRTFGDFFASRQELLMIRRRQEPVGMVRPSHFCSEQRNICMEGQCLWDRALYARGYSAFSRKLQQ